MDSIFGRIDWSGFLEHAKEKFPEEVCGFLFAKNPYTQNERWMVATVDNVADDPRQAWQPDKKQMAEVKSCAKTARFTKIGNVLSHPCKTELEFYQMVEEHEKKEYGKIEAELEQMMYELYIIEVIQPSEKDLHYARRFNDVARGIVAVSSEGIHAIRFHDQFNNEIAIQMMKSGLSLLGLLELGAETGAT
ncbi:MAG: hypothetical protein MUP55_04120 [Candidatus Aenigmarchaeota archaeon]|nr:hypothetical protein [Candidatus Aenigmarchaeota archaeon]